MPYLEGERTPPLPDARGQLVGMTLRNLTPANLARAAVEGVLWSLAYGVQVLREQIGEISAITLTGGASQSDAVRKIATAVFGLPIVVTDTFESVAVGAARQAGLGPDRVAARMERPGAQPARPDPGRRAGRRRDRRALRLHPGGALRTLVVAPVSSSGV